MRALLWIFVTTVVLAPTARAGADESSAATRTWTFEQDAPDTPPAGFTLTKTDGGRPPRWIVRSVAEAPSGHKVLAQVDDDPSDSRFPIAVANEPSLRDLRLSVRCRPVAGHLDQACGLVFRFRDENDYYLARANALEDNVRLYVVKDGQRRQLASWKGSVESGAWQELRVEALGNHLEVYWEGTKAMDLRDGTFPDAGKVGVWTKADSITEFDDLTLAPVVQE